MFGHIFAHNVKVIPMTTTTNDQLAGGTDLPASGSFIDVSPYERVDIIVRNGVIHNSDEPTLQPKVAESASGTLDVIDASLVHTIDPADDNEFTVWTIEVRKLAEDHCWLALDVAGTVSNGSFVDAFLLGHVESAPATQTTAVLPTTSQYIWAG